MRTGGGSAVSTRGLIIAGRRVFPSPLVPCPLTLRLSPLRSGNASYFYKAQRDNTAASAAHAGNPCGGQPEPASSDTERLCRVVSCRRT